MTSTLIAQVLERPFNHKKVLKTIVPEPCTILLSEMIKIVFIIEQDYKNLIPHDLQNVKFEEKNKIIKSTRELDKLIVYENKMIRNYKEPKVFNHPDYRFKSIRLILEETDYFNFFRKFHIKNTRIIQSKTDFKVSFFLGSNKNNKYNYDHSEALKKLCNEKLQYNCKIFLGEKSTTLVLRLVNNSIEPIKLILGENITY